MEFETLGQWILGIPFVIVAAVGFLDWLLQLGKRSSDTADTEEAGAAPPDDVQKAA